MFKIGDTVIYIGDNHIFKGKTGVIIQNGNFFPKVSFDEQIISDDGELKKDWYSSKHSLKIIKTNKKQLTR